MSLIQRYLGHWDHVGGRYQEILLEDVIDKYGDLQGQKMAGTRTSYYVPFSKKAVDDIIATSNNTDKNNIKFVFKNETHRCDEYNYQQFVNSDWNLMNEMMTYQSGPRNWEYLNNKFTKERQDYMKSNTSIK